ncbi:MAG: glycine--tRNA ligase subunit beta [Desulfobacterales bacterium]|nr:glycine--tRNA ligase subunit beta [Desulfobacterales bacterium]
MERLLVEIGTEEIPAGYIQPALDALSSNLMKRLEGARIDHGAAKTYGTPRRLSVEVFDVALKQKSVTTELIGPPEKVGYDEQGRPTVAAEKFAEKIGLPLSKLSITETEKGRYLCGTKTERGLATRTLLKEILPEVILATPFPKRMRWADLAVEFARPVHHILALLGEKVVTFSIGSVKSGRFTRGHYFMSPKKIKINRPEEYLEALGKAHVIADIEERRRQVDTLVREAAQRSGGRILPDEELLDTVTNLVELPVPVVGNFETKFLEIPDEILITAMREHQKYFAIIDADGRLMPCFVAVNNTRTRDMKLVATGHERVIRARLEDGRFFYRSDMGASFDEWVKQLKGVLFQARLGSMYEKMLRVKDMAEYLAEAAGGAGLRDQAGRAAYLCKADLISEVVGEFPKLQGVMGRVYAAAKNEPPGVAAAIEEHYRPVRSGGVLPEGEIGSVLAIADKIDSIVGCFSVGLIPTGAADPYALRRQGIGIVQILLHRRFSFSLKALIAKSAAMFAEKSDNPPEKIADLVYMFLKNRMAHLLAEEGFAKDAVAAVLEVSADSVPDVWDRVRALDNLRKAPDFEPLAVAFKRVVNIIRQGETLGADRVDPSLFEDESETALRDAFERVSASVKGHLAAGEYDQALREIAALREPVDAFFEGVMVLTDNARIRTNRLALLSGIAGLFDQFADFSRIST